MITQETGFSNILPTGSGLFTFSSMEEILEAIAKINGDYARHSKAASEIAFEYFRAETVLAGLLQQAGVSLPQQSPAHNR